MMKIDSSGAELVLPIYALVIFPVGLFVLHDLIDARFRTVQNIRLWMTVYIILYAVCTGIIMFYIFTQVMPREEAEKDFKEMGAALVVIALGIFCFLKLVRVWMILKAHKSIIESEVWRADWTLNRLLFGENYAEASKPERWNIPLFRRTRQWEDSQHWKDRESSSTLPPPNQPPLLQRMKVALRGMKPFAPLRSLVDSAARCLSSAVRCSRSGKRACSVCAGKFNRISSVVFDDDYPGDSTRIRWFSYSNCFQVEVVDSEADFCAVQLAMYMRVVLRDPGVNIWTLICATTKLTTMTAGRTSVGKMIRRLLRTGTAEQTPEHARWNKCGLPGRDRNPVENYLLIKSFKDPKSDRESALFADNMVKFGAELYWIAIEMSDDEVQNALTALPGRWTRNNHQTGKELVYEIALLFILQNFVKDDAQAPSGLPFEVAPNESDYLYWRMKYFKYSMGRTSADDIEVSASNPVQLAQSWVSVFREERTRKVLAVTCADLVLPFLTLDYVMDEIVPFCQHPPNSTFSIGSVKASIQRELRIRFDNFFNYISSAEVDEDGCEGVEVAIQDLFITARYAGQVANEIVGKTNLEQTIYGLFFEHHFLSLPDGFRNSNESWDLETQMNCGDFSGIPEDEAGKFWKGPDGQGSMAALSHSDFVTGFASILTQLGLTKLGDENFDLSTDGRQSDAYMSMLIRWSNSCLFPGEDPPEISVTSTDMFAILEEKLKSNGLTVPTTTERSALWMIDINQKSPCPNHSIAFASHAVIARYLAEGIFCLLEPWSDGSQVAPGLVEFPAQLLGPAPEAVYDWMEWKRELQGARQLSDVGTGRFYHFFANSRREVSNGQ